MKAIKLVGVFIFLVSLYYLYLFITNVEIVSKVVSIFVGIYLLTASIGIYNIKNWARKMLVIISTIFILFDCFAFITFMPGRVKLLPGLVFYSLLLFYFLRRKTKGFFIK